MADGAKQPSPGLAYLLAGAGARAVFQAGVLEVLFDDPRFATPQIYAGTSGGAVNAALLAAGKTPRDVRDFWFAFARTPPVDANVPFIRKTIRTLATGALHSRFGLRHEPRGGSLRWVLGRAWKHKLADPGNLVAFLVEMLLTRNYGIVSYLFNEVPDPAVLNAKPLRDLVVAALGGERVATRPGIRLAVNAVDIRACRPARFVNTATHLTTTDEYIVTETIDVDMVLGSAAIPFLFPAVATSDRRLWDGGLLVNTPLASAVSLGASQIIPIMSNAAVDGARPFRNMGDALQRVVDIIVENCFNLDRKLMLERNKVSRMPSAQGERQYRPIDLFEAIRPGNDAVFDTGSYLNFSIEKLQAMYDDGRIQATAWLASGPRLDSM